MSARETARELAQEIATHQEREHVPGAWTDLLDDAKNLHRAKRLNSTPAEQLIYLHHLAWTTERITRATVDASREAGHTWQSIGDLLHITKQAAQQRYGTKP